MANRWIDGFNYYAGFGGGDFASVGYALPFTGVLIDPNGRWGTNCMLLSGPAAVLNLPLDNQPTFIVGWAGKSSAWQNTTGGIICALRDAGSNQVELRVDSSRRLYVTRNGTTILGPGTIRLQNDIFYYFEMKATIHASAGAVEVRVSGQTELSGTGLNTQATANAYANEVILSGASSGGSITHYVDDLYINDATGTINNDFWGDIRVDVVYPSAAGNYAQWSPSAGSNYQNVDETTAGSDADSTYNSSSTAGQKDSFAYPDLAANVTAVLAVKQSIKHRKDDAGSRQVRTLARVASTDYAGSTENSLDAYQYAHTLRETNPNTGSPFTPTEFNGAEFGYELVS